MTAYKKIIAAIGMMAFGMTTFAQDNVLEVNNHADCESMLTIETKRTLGPTTSPVGYGTEQEFKHNSRNDRHFMEQENNSVWYKFAAKTNGSLSFELEPLDSLNDYDFALYEYSGENFCADVKNKKILPIRTNFSRNKAEIKGKTGLSASATDEFVTAGINPAYSKAVAVQPKAEYVLLVNNVYDNGAGHILHFDYSVNLKLNGSVVDIESTSSLEANITLTNTKTGLVVAETTSDSVTGAYKLVFDLPKSQLNDPLHLEIYKDDYFFHDTIITAFNIATKMRDIKLTTKIKKMKKGDRFVVNNILFYGGSPKPMPGSMATIKALYKTMKRNKKLRIIIEGHTNGCPHGIKQSENLSNARAATVFEFLTKNKIDEDRLASVGYGCQQMLYSETGSRAFLNRRVEIEIVDL